MFPCISYGSDDKITDFSLFGAGYSCIKHFDKQNARLITNELVNEMADSAGLNRADAYKAINIGIAQVQEAGYEICDTIVIGSVMVLNKYSKNHDVILSMKMLANKFSEKDYFNIEQTESNNKCIEKELSDQTFNAQYIIHTFDDDGNITLNVKRNSDGKDILIGLSPEIFEDNFANVDEGDILKLTLGRQQTGEFDYDAKQCATSYYFKSGYNTDDSAASMNRTGLTFGDLITQAETVKYLACEEYVSDEAKGSDIPKACAKYKTNDYILFRKGGKGHVSGDGGKTKTPITWTQNTDKPTCIRVVLGDKDGGFCLHKNLKYLDGRGNPYWGLFTAYIIDNFEQ